MENSIFRAYLVFEKHWSFLKSDVLNYFNIPAQKGASRADLFALFCSEVWQQRVRHVPSPGCLPTTTLASCLVTSILLPVLPLLLTARDSPFLLVKYRRLAEGVWWLLAVLCMRRINKVGKKTSNIFSFSLLCGTRRSNLLKRNYSHWNEYSFFL